jgi:hypothetical protein
MRHKVREQSYVDPDLLRKAQAYAAAKRWKHSAFTTEAYKKFFEVEGGSNRDLVIRRLDLLTQQTERLQSSLEILGMTFALYAEVWCRSLPASPGTPDASQRAEKVYGEFMRGVATRFNAGRRLQGEVFPAASDVPPRPGSGATGGGGKGGGLR